MYQFIIPEIVVYKTKLSHYYALTYVYGIMDYCLIILSLSGFITCVQKFAA